MDLSVFPTVNASLNFTAACLLILGYRAIKAGKKETHKKFMIAALACSILFLGCYLSYHYMHGSTKYEGEGLMRFLYFSILITHTPLAVLIVPFIIAAVYFALKGDLQKHKKIVKWVYPCWMYVSVTGVVIYLMLYVF